MVVGTAAAQHIEPRPSALERELEDAVLGMEQNKSDSLDIDKNENESDCSSGSDGPVKCSAVHTMERDMPDFDYSHLVKELREKVLKSCHENPGTYSEIDFERLKNDEWFVSRFLLRQKLDVKAAHEMMCKAMKYRNELLVTNMNEFPAEFYQIGGLFYYEPDRKGNVMVYVRVKVHRKIPEIQLILEAFLFHVIRQADEAANGRGISIALVCSGGGLMNADMDMLLFLVSSLVNYFPKGLSYLLVHELPWILKPVWHIAKNWISDEHRQLIKFSNVETIFEYVDKENLPDFLGGTCKRDYRAPPENCSTLMQAAKLWGLEPEVVKKILSRYADYLPADRIAQIDEEL